MIVGINGKAGSGKDTIADMLVERGFVKLAFADEIKRTAARWWGFRREQLFGPSERRGESPPGRDGPTGRKAGQHIGTEVARALDPTLWPDIAIEVARFLMHGTPRICDFHLEYDAARGLRLADGWEPPPRGVVIPDMRFENEIDLVSEAGGILLRVKRPGAGLTGAAAWHKSETEQDKIPDSRFHVVLDNDGDLDLLRAKVALVCEEWSL